MDVFAEIAAERRLIADLLEGLSPEQLDTPSLCDGWSVRDVGAHLLMPVVVSTPKLMMVMARNKMDFNRANLDLTRQVARRTTPEIIAGLRDGAEHRFTPPGSGPEAPLTDCLVHGQDMRRPLGIVREFPPDRLAAVLGYLAGGHGRGFVPRSRVAGLAFTATDLDWQMGSGDEVAGPGEALMMGMAGRRVALAELTGPGVQILAERIN